MTSYETPSVTKPVGGESVRSPAHIETIQQGSNNQQRGAVYTIRDGSQKSWQQITTNPPGRVSIYYLVMGSELLAMRDQYINKRFN